MPIHTVGVGPEQVKSDLELERLDVATSAPVGSTVTAQVGIRHEGATATRLRVYDRETLVAARDIQLSRDSNVTSLTIDLPAGEPGTHELRFVLDQLEGERNVINNSRTRVVDVPATRRNILYVEGEPRWEYKFVRRAAERDRALRGLSQELASIHAMLASAGSDKNLIEAQKARLEAVLQAYKVLFEAASD